jgi:hypothetical protein
MLEQLFEISRKAVESSLQMQQAMFKQVTQDWLSASPAAAGLSADWGGTVKKRWLDATLEALNKHRETVDSSYKAGIQTIEQAIRVSEAKSTEEAVRGVEDIWRKLFDSLKGQSEVQFSEFQKWAEKSFEVVRKQEA